MTQRAQKPGASSKLVQFPPEADGEFGIVAERDIAVWREKLNKRYGIGSGRLRVVDDPGVAA